ncbi:MAG: site-specific integrase [Ruminococcus flavefaciens]|nr:site-specific integrase [Ruminococcus flavefaciens]
MNLNEWIDLGISNGVVDMPEIEEKTFEEIYRQWFRMKLNVIRAQSCDRIEVTYNRYYAGSELVCCRVSALDESAFVRFFTGIIIGRGNITPKEFSRIFQIASNVMSYARYLNLGGARLLDWEAVRRYVPDGKLMPDYHQDFAVPKADVEKLLQLVVVRNVYPLKRSACLCLVMNFFLGLRVGELASLTWQDIDHGRRVVRVCKTETKAYSRDDEGNRCGTMVYQVVEDLKTVYSVREIPLLPEAVYILEVLRSHHEACGYESPYLAYDGRDTILVRSLDRTLRKLCRYCEVSYFNTHMIRKTFATMLHASGMPTRYISDLLGHSEMVTTERNYILSYRDNYDTLLGYMRQGLDFKLKGQD